MKIVNANQLPKVYYGLHMEPGVAEYRESGKEPYRIFLNESTIKDMDASFAGRPVFVQHVDEVDLKNIQNEADGYVVKSFFNKFDGKTWCEFLVVSDRGHEHIKKGWRLSNSYFPRSMGPGGLWHGVEYSKEVIKGEYDHLAIVNNPRYESSVILTPEEFKKYNSEKEKELLDRVSNSQGEKSMLNFFKKQKIENSVDIENTAVAFEDGTEMTIKEMHSEISKLKNSKGYALPEQMVKVGEGEMSLADLLKNHEAVTNELNSMKKKNTEADEEAKKKALEIAAHEDEEMKKKNEEEEKKKKEKEEEDKKKNALDEARRKEEERIANELENASKATPTIVKEQLKVGNDLINIGRARYGSK